jgi:ligand-binding sensor domain-containing protein
MQLKITISTIALLLFSAAISFSQPVASNYSNLNDVHSIHFPNGTLWIGTSGGVVSRLESESFTNHHILTVDDGLGSNFITAITTDFNGTKFFGSFDNGVTIYKEGSTPQVFNSANSPLDNRIFCLATDNSGNVWAGTPSGAFRYNGSDWDSFNTDSEVPGEVRAISVDGSNVWFATYGNGLKSYNGSSFNELTTSNSGLHTNQLTALVVRNDSIFAGSENGVSFYNPGNSSWDYDNTFVSSIFELDLDPYGIVYAATLSGMYTYSGSVWNQDFIYGSQPIVAFEFQSFNRWYGFGKDGNGIWRTDGSTPTWFQINGPEYPGKNNISDIVSGNNIVYFTTPGSGMSTYDGTQWSIYDADMPSLFLTSAALQGDTLWVGSDNGAIRFFQGTWDSYTVISPMVNAVAVDKSDPNRIWCGTSSGVTSLYNKMIESNYSGTNGLLTDEVVAITVDFNNKVWFLHKTGISVYNGGTFELYDIGDLGLTSGQLNDIEADLVSDSVWIASDQGVIVFNGGNPRLINTDNSELTDNNVLTVKVTDQNYKLFGTDKRGLSILTYFGWQKITRTNGIITNHITAVNFEVNRNLIWTAGEWGGISQTSIPPISVDIAPLPDFVCYGNPVTLSAEVNGGFGPASYKYSWSSSDGSFNSTSQTETIYPENSTSYYLEVNDGYNGGSMTAFIDINKIDTSEIRGLDTICPNGQTVIYDAISSAATVRSYSWTIEGGSIVNSDPTGTKVEVLWDSDRTLGKLLLTESDDNFCSVNQSFDVFINIDAIPDVVLKQGEQILICTDSGYVYQWYKDDNMIPGATRQFYYLDPANGATSGSYYVIMDNGQNCILKSAIFDIKSSLQKAYPVPTQTFLNIELENEIIGSGKALIKDISGHFIDEISFSKEAIFKRLEINVENYKPGTYFYSILLGNQFIRSGKFVVN